MAFPSIPHPNPTALALAFGGLLLAARRPAARRRPRRPGRRLPARPRPGGARREWRCWRGRRGARRAPRRTGRRVACRPDGARRDRRAPAPSGTRRSASRSTSSASSACRCPGAWHGGFEPNKILEFYYALPAAGGGRAVARGGDRAAACRSGSGPPRRWPRAGVVYLLARADVYHLVPLAAVLPVLLATAAARERRPKPGDGPRRCCRARPDRPPGARPQAHPAARPAAAGDDRRRRGRRREGADRRGARAHRVVAATSAPGSRPASRSSSPTRASTWSASATRSSTCWSAAPTPPATT